MSWGKRAGEAPISENTYWHLPAADGATGGGVPRLCPKPGLLIRRYRPAAGGVHSVPVHAGGTFRLIASIPARPDAVQAPPAGERPPRGPGCRYRQWVPVTAPSLPSKSEINRCGSYLVQVMEPTPEAPLLIEWSEYEHAFDVVAQFRAAHSYPLTKVVNGLRSMVQSESCPIVVSQRLKRLPRIVRKLQRMPNSNLARLEDIGGCRAVLPDGPALQAVERRLRKRWSFIRERDYIATPKDIGYRAVHLVVERDGRRIEVQLRTRGQQQWADAIEAIDARLGLTMKDGRGPDELIEYFRLAGEVIHAREYGLRLSATVAEEFARARDAVVAAGYYTR